MTLEQTIRDLKEKLGYNGSYQRKSKYLGKEFDRKKEVQTINKLKKAMEQVDKIHSDLQYPNTVDTVTRVWEKLNDAYIGLNTYLGAIKDGKYDGKIEQD
jgi:hypothetical protein